MATKLDFIEYLCGQIAGTGFVKYRKMFGEYMVYVNDKPIILVCNNTAYIKKYDFLGEKMKGSETGIPYEGSKEHYILDVDNGGFCREIISLVEPFVLVPVKKKSKKSIKIN
jgi:hypothetical protein